MTSNEVQVRVVTRTDKRGRRRQCGQYRRRLSTGHWSSVWYLLPAAAAVQALETGLVSLGGVAGPCKVLPE